MKKCTMLVSLLLLAQCGMTAETTGDSLFVRIAGDSVSIWDLHAEENCASRFMSSLAISHDTLTWVQTDTIGPLVRCICTYDMVVSMTGLTAGPYIARVFRDRRKEYHYSSDTLECIGAVAFVVTASAGQFAARAFSQSECQGATGVEVDVALIPAQMSLCNYPNPFNPTTVISCQLPVASKLRLGVYDMLGREVAILANEQKPAGVYNVRFDGAGLSSGVYFCRLNAEPVGDGVADRMMQSKGPTILTTMMMLAK